MARPSPKRSSRLRWPPDPRQQVHLEHLRPAICRRPWPAASWRVETLDSSPPSWSNPWSSGSSRNWVCEDEDRLFKRPFSFSTAPRTRQHRSGTQRPRRLNLSLGTGCDLLGVDSPAEMRLSGCRLRVTPCRQAVSIGPVATATQPTPAAPRAGTLEQWGIEIVRPPAALDLGPAHGAVPWPATPGA